MSYISHSSCFKELHFDVQLIEKGKIYPSSVQSGWTQSLAYQILTYILDMCFVYIRPWSGLR